MKKLLLLSFLATGLFSMAQFGMRLPSANIGNSKWTVGGYAGLSGAFGGGGGTGLYISPRVGYKVTEDLEAGMGANLNWSNSSYVSSTMIGIGPFVNYYIKRTFFLSSNFQQYFVNQKIKTSGAKYSTQESALYLGGGYMQRLGNRAYMQIGGMYNVLYDANKSVFAGAFIPQVGIVYGL